MVLAANYGRSEDPVEEEETCPPTQVPSDQPDLEAVLILRTDKRWMELAMVQQSCFRFNHSGCTQILIKENSHLSPI